VSPTPPLRLRDDPTVARALRDDLAREAARSGADYDVGAGLARFEAALSPRAPTPRGHEGGAPQAPGAAVAGGKTVLGAAIKGALLGLAVIGGAAAIGDRSPSPVSVAAPLALSRSSVARLEAPAVAPSETAHPALPSPPDVTKPPATPAPPRRPAPSEATPAPPAQASAAEIAPEPAPPAPLLPGAGGTSLPAKDDALAAEMEHLVRLRTLRDADPAQALALAAEGSRRFPAGYFAQEREAIAIAALVRLGRQTEARARAGAFLSSYPRSAFGERIRNLTGLRVAP
jgi:hypothetical protein